MNGLHDRKDGKVVRQSPHALCADNFHWVKIVVTNEVFLNNEHGASEELSNEKENDTEDHRASGTARVVITAFQSNRNISNLSDTDDNTGNADPMMRVLLLFEEDDGKNGRHDVDEAAHHLIYGSGDHR